jgi:hypothetical protein
MVAALSSGWAHGGCWRAFLLAARTDGPDASFTDGFWVGVV